MPITTLDPRTALVVIDLQKGIVAYPTAHPIGGVIGNAAALAAAFRQHHLPVVLVNVIGGAPGRADQSHGLVDLPADWAELVPEMAPQSGDHTVSKRTWGAFTGTDLAAHLKAKGVTQIVLCGVATSIGVESTARQANELGLHVTLALDAMTDMNADAHAHSTTRIFPRLGETGSTQQIIDQLGRAR